MILDFQSSPINVFARASPSNISVIVVLIDHTLSGTSGCVSVWMATPFTELNAFPIKTTVMIQLQTVLWEHSLILNKKNV